MFQFRAANSGKPFFAYERDVLNLYPFICKHATERLNPANLHPAIRALSEHVGGVGNEDLILAAVGLREFVNGANHSDPSNDDIAALWTKSGLDRVKPAALLALFFQIGVGTTHYYFDLLRKAIEQGRPVPLATELGAHIDRVIFGLRADDPAARRRRLEDAAGNPIGDDPCARNPG